MKSHDVLLDEESLKRHYDFVNPNLIKVAKFEISNRYNEFKNRKKQPQIELKEGKKTKELLQDIREENKKDKKQHPMDVVVNGLILGVIPKSNQIDDIIKQAKSSQDPVKAIHIFSITDEFEQGMQGMLQPRELEELQKKHGIEFKHHQVPMTDFGAEITSQSILATVYKMQKIIEEGGTVYIHCKAGRARSAMIVAAYLSIFGNQHNLEWQENDATNPPLNQAVKFLKDKRSQVDLHEIKVTDWKNLMQQKGGIAKLQKAQEAINLHNAIVLKLKIEGITTRTTDDYINKFNEYTKKQWKGIDWEKTPVKKISKIEKMINQLMHKNEKWNFNLGTTVLSNLEFKNILIDLTSFKQLKIYATHAQNYSKQTSELTQYVNAFLKQIYEAKDNNWYEELKNNKGHLWKLYNHSKATDDIKQIINSFITDIDKYYHNKMQVKMSVAPMPNSQPTVAFEKINFSRNPATMYFNKNLNESPKFKILRLLTIMEKNLNTSSDEFKQDKRILEQKLTKLKNNQPFTQDDKNDIEQIDRKMNPSIKLKR